MLFHNLPTFRTRDSWQVYEPAAVPTGERLTYEVGGLTLAPPYDWRAPFQPDALGRDDLLSRIDRVNQVKVHAFDCDTEADLVGMVDGFNAEIAEQEPLYALTGHHLTRRPGVLAARIALFRGFYVTDQPLHHRTKVRSVLQGRKGQAGTMTYAHILRQVE